MKYRLPGIYLGNISMDLFMEYMKDEDLSNQNTRNDYYLTSDRTENIKIFKVTFTYNSKNFKLYTYDIADPERIREMVRSHFHDIINNESDPLFDYNTVIDAMVFTIEPSTEHTSPILYDTLGDPSVYGPYFRTYNGYDLKMVTLEGKDGKKLDTYDDLKQYVDESTQIEPIEVTLFDLRTEPNTPISVLNIDMVNNAYAFGDISVELLDFVKDVNDEIIDVRTNIFYYGKKSMLKKISNGEFVYKDRLGRATNSFYRNVMMNDIENNRKINDQSVRIKMISGANEFKGRAGIVRQENVKESVVGITFSKYDQYDINRRMELVETIPANSDIRYVDVEPKTIKSVEEGVNNVYEFEYDRVLSYTDLANTDYLPKFKAIYSHGTSNEEHRYYIFDTIRGVVPDFSESDPKVCLLDVYTNCNVSVKSGGRIKNFPIKYSVSPDQKYIFRTINVDGKDFYIKMSDSEKELTAYIIIPSDSVSDSVKVYATAQDLLDDYPFDRIGFNVDLDDIYPISYTQGEGGGSTVSKWGINVALYGDETITVEVNDGDPDSVDVQLMSDFMDTSELTGRSYVRLPVTLDIAADSVEIINDVMVTMNATRLISANDYGYEVSGYYTTSPGELGSYSVSIPDFSEFNIESTRPYKNIRSYLELNGLDSTHYKEYYVVNNFDQSKKYLVRDEIVHSEASDNPSPYDNTFLNISNKLSPEINENTINFLVSEVGTTINIDKRGRLIESDILGNGLVDDLGDEFRRGFNDIFYGIKNYDYSYKVDDIKDTEKLNFLRNSLVTYKSLHSLIDSFLRFNYVSKNEYLYTIDKNFRMGFYVRKDMPEAKITNTFTDWSQDIDVSTYDPDRLNVFQKIKAYEKMSSDQDISNKLKTDWVRDNKLKNVSNETNTGYVVKRKDNVIPQDINNRDMINQAISMLMDQKYSVISIIDSFSKTNIKKVTLINNKEKSLYTNTHNQARYINSNQNLNVMINAYLSGFDKKVGG